MFYRVQAKKMVGIKTVDTVIQNSTHEKFLCFTFDSKVNCDKNIKKLCEKARAKLKRPGQSKSLYINPYINRDNRKIHFEGIEIGLEEVSTFISINKFAVKF